MKSLILCDPYQAKVNSKKYFDVLSLFIPGLSNTTEKLFKELDEVIISSYNYHYAIIKKTNNYDYLDRLVNNGKRLIYYHRLIKDYEKLHFELTLSENHIDGYNHFLKEFPNSVYKNEIIHKRRMQYFNVNKLTSQQISIDSIIARNPCYIPFLLMRNDTNGNYVQMEDVINQSMSDPKYKYRYIVADLNTYDKNGNCRGIKESYATLDELPEFAHLKDFALKTGTFVRSFKNISEPDLIKLAKNPRLKQPILLDTSTIDTLLAEIDCLNNYLTEVDTFRKEPMNKAGVNFMWSTNYCVGQTMCFCELNEDTVKMITRFITASRGEVNHFAFTGDGLKNYFYAPFNYIHSRYWDTDRRHSDYDKLRDKELGGGSKGIFLYKTHIELSDFMGFYPDKHYPIACRGNGIHELTEAPMFGSLMGTPSSIGCLRLFGYQAKWARWWTPMYARLYIYLEEDRYIQVTKRKKSDYGKILSAGKYFLKK